MIDEEKKTGGESDFGENDSDTEKLVPGAEDQPPKNNYDKYTGEYIGGGERPTERQQNNYDKYTGKYIGGGERPTERQQNNYDKYTGEYIGGYKPINDDSANGFDKHTGEYTGGNAGGDYGGSVKSGGTAATVALVCGVLSVVVSFLFGISLVVGIFAVIAAAVQMKKEVTGKAVAGLITGIVGMALAVVFIIVYAYVGAGAAPEITESLYLLT